MKTILLRKFDPAQGIRTTACRPLFGRQSPSSVVQKEDRSTIGRRADRSIDQALPRIAR
jgi:hypothetical protein